ncbi:MAG: SDR family oxidoreductase [Gammaproteobacteria bacterium]
MATPRPGLRFVIGATGYIGGYLVPRLLSEGIPVRAAARDLAQLERLDWEGVDKVEADALKPETLLPALEGVDTAYYLIHSMAAGSDFRRIDLECAENFAKAAAQAGVRRIVYLGGLKPSDATSEHLVSRQESGDRLRAGSVPVTEVRAGIIVGPGSAAFEVIRDLVNNLPVMVAPRWVTAKSPPIALANLLEYLVRLPELEQSAGNIYDAAGPEMLSYEDLMRIFGEIVGKNPRIIRVPVLTPTLSSYWLGLVTSVPKPVASALIAGLRHDIPADPGPLRKLVPQKLLTYRQAVEVALEAERMNAVSARWVEGSLMYRNYRQDYGYYAKQATGTAVADASPDAVWKVVSSLGGDNRYFSLDFLWTLRELGDWLVGGPGLNHGRRDPENLRIGDAVDSWHVIGLEEKRRLTLLFGMKAPGAGILEFVIEPEEEGTRVTATAYWHPAGVWGLLYWYPLAPFHGLIFDTMTRQIAERAEALESGATPASA